MKKFDADYQMLQAMYQDGYFPNFLVDKVRALVWDVVEFLEAGERDPSAVQKKFDGMTLAINGLQGEFEDNGSELETVARDSIGETVGYILQWFGLDMEAEDAIGLRDW